MFTVTKFMNRVSKAGMISLGASAFVVAAAMLFAH